MAAWGQQTWGFENWGTLGDTSVTLSSTNLSASFSIGTIIVDAELQVGWGGDTWGENAWGDLSGSNPEVTGIQASFSIGSLTTTADANVTVSGIELTVTNAGAVGGTSVDQLVTGQQLSLSGGEETVGIGVPVTGSQVSTLAGQTTIDPTYLIGAGWGRDTWGNLGWGVNYSAAPSMAQLDISLGDENAFTDVDVTVTSPDALSITYASPAFSIQVDQDIFVLASEDQIDASVGSIVNTADANVEVTNSAPNFEFTAQGNAALSTVQAKFGPSSLELDGTDDIVDTTTNLDLSSGDFTIDLWIRPNSVSGYKGIWESGTSSKLVSYLLGNTVYLSVGGSTIISNSVTVSANEWTMLSYERVGNNHYVYKNGTLEDTGNTANRPDNGIFSIGESSFGDFNGYIDEFRVSNVARYSGSSFTEPTEAFTFDSDTQFLLHFDGANGSTVIKSADDTLFQSTSSIGTVVAGLFLDVPVTGSEISMTLGNFSLEQSTNETATGQELTSSLGNPEEIPGQIIGLSGFEITSSIGSVTITATAEVQPTGNLANISTGSVSTQGWNEIDPGVNNIWSDVDLAA